MALPPLTPTYNLSRSLTESRNLLDDLQRQLASGKKATTYGGLGNDRTQVLSFRSELSQLEGYQRTATITNTRLETMQLSLEHMRELVADTRSDALSGDFEVQLSGQTTFQAEAAARFVDVVGLLNTKVADNYVFGGRDTQSPPTAAADAILNGTATKAGFSQVAEERRLADLGASGQGRLDVTSPAADTVNLAEDGVAAHPFGFKLAGATSTLTGTTVTGPAGSPVAVDVTFTAALPADGETITFTLDLPDGSTTDVTLTARTGTADEPGEFLIGADENATAANFQTALSASLQSAAQNELRTASLFTAADNFFDITDTASPQRVDGPPYETATGFVPATDADTVLYYQGEVSATSARRSAVAKIDDTIAVGVGARANEDAFREVLKNFAVLAVETFDPNDPIDEDRYSAIAQRVHDNLQFTNSSQSIDVIITELAVAQESVGSAQERHDASEAMLQGFVDEAENSDVYEVSAQILNLQTRLEASLAVTAALTQTSLINFL